MLYFIVALFVLAKELKCPSMTSWKSFHRTKREETTEEEGAPSQQKEEGPVLPSGRSVKRREEDAKPHKRVIASLVYQSGSSQEKCEQGKLNIKT